jgi:hypothetical protein
MILEAKAWIEANMSDAHYDLAKVHAFLGDNDKAMSLLKQWKPNWGLHAWVDRDPLFESLRDLPEFKRLVVDLVAQIGELNKQVDEKVANGEFPTPQMIK